MNTSDSESTRKDVQDANTCLALGAGLGALGTGAALLTGATCPLCVVVAPALIGVGLWKRLAAGRQPGFTNEAPAHQKEEDRILTMSGTPGERNSRC